MAKPRKGREEIYKLYLNEFIAIGNFAKQNGNSKVSIKENQIFRNVSYGKINDDRQLFGSPRICQTCNYHMN